MAEFSACWYGVDSMPHNNPGSNQMRNIYLDLETTGLSPAKSHVVEIAIADDDGVVLNTLIQPLGLIPIEATAIHGITDEMVRGMPMMSTVLPLLLSICGRPDATLVIYNKAYDLQFLPSILSIKAECCMIAAQHAMGLKRWPRLTAAAEWAGYVWDGAPHRAISDVLATRHVWQTIAGRA